MSHSPVDVTRPSRLTRVLEHAEDLAQNGEHTKAYRASLNATMEAPRYAAAWHLRAETATSLEERIFCLSRLCALDPHFPPAKEKIHKAVRQLLEHEPSLAYLNETDTLYQLRSGLDLFLNVPKYRSRLEPYPAKRLNPTGPAYRLLGLAIIGLLFGGIGAFVLAPLAAYQAFRVQLQPLDRKDRIRSFVAIVLSTLLWIVALPLVFLFILHLLP